MISDNEKKETPAREEGGRDNFVLNAVTVEGVDTEVRDAFLALTAEMKGLSERMGLLNTR